MIINQNKEVVVPDKTIAFFPVIQHDGLKKFDIKDIGLFLKPLNTDHKRDWFFPNFYRCLPLSIGNMQGFVFSLPYSIDILWNGGNNIEDIKINYCKDFEKYEGYNFIYVASNFGHGILTIHFPITLKTPPGINLMTIAPPNFPTPGLSPMTGVVESDNLRFSFTLNIKIDLPNTVIQIGPDTPLVGLIPIPRYFCDSFELKNAYEIFDKSIVDNEVNTVYKHGKLRDELNEKKIKGDGLYYAGKDVLGNKFKDHQLPKKNNS
jgi:hypothetical protein